MSETETRHDFISFAEASRRIPKVDGRRVTRQTVARWAREGLMIFDGEGASERVKLQSVAVAHTRVTTHRWLATFLDVAAK